MTHDFADAASRRANAPSLDAFWMPFTANRQFKAAPRLLVEAQGMHYTAQDGRACSTAPPASGASTRATAGAHRRRRRRSS